MNEIRFLCGCVVPLHEREKIVDEDTIVVEKTIGGHTSIDPEGMLTCREHGARRYGWRSLPTVTLVKEDGTEIQTGRGDYRFGGKTPQEIEQHVFAEAGIVGIR